MTKRLSGGYEQKLAQLKAEEEQANKSKLATELISLWSWGSMSAPLVQTLSNAACQDGLNHPQVKKMVKRGGGWKVPWQHAEEPPCHGWGTQCLAGGGSNLHSHPLEGEQDRKESRDQPQLAQTGLATLTTMV